MNDIAATSAVFYSLVTSAAKMHVVKLKSFYCLSIFELCFELTRVFQPSWKCHHILWRGQPVSSLQQEGVFW